MNLSLTTQYFLRGGLRSATGGSSVANQQRSDRRIAVSQVLAVTRMSLANTLGAVYASERGRP